MFYLHTTFCRKKLWGRILKIVLTVCKLRNLKIKFKWKFISTRCSWRIVLWSKLWLLLAIAWANHHHVRPSKHHPSSFSCDPPSLLSALRNQPTNTQRQPHHETDDGAYPSIKLTSWEQRNYLNWCMMLHWSDNTCDLPFQPGDWQLSKPSAALHQQTLWILIYQYWLPTRSMVWNEQPCWILTKIHSNSWLVCLPGPATNTIHQPQSLKNWEHDVTTDD